jgi:malonyl CoA-acyl carrier protein transacylase
LPIFRFSLTHCTHVEHYSAAFKREKRRSKKERRKAFPLFTPLLSPLQALLHSKHNVPLV